MTATETVLVNYLDGLLGHTMEQFAELQTDMAPRPLRPFTRALGEANRKAVAEGKLKAPKLNNPIPGKCWGRPGQDQEPIHAPGPGRGHRHPVLRRRAHRRDRPCPR